MPHIFDIENNRFKIILYFTFYDVLKRSRGKAILIPKGYIAPDDLPIEDLKRKLDRIGFPYVYINSGSFIINSGLFSYVPLFFYVDHEGRNVYVADEIYTLLQIMKNRKDKALNSLCLNSLNKLAESEFIVFGYTLGDKTLIEKDIKILEAGKNLLFNDDELKIKTEFIYYSPQKIKDEKSLEELLLNAIKDVFRDILSWSRSRKIIVPLSSGYDSRFIATMLYLMNYKNVCTITYGLPNTEEPIAKKIAERLGFEHIFIEYSPHTFSKLLPELPAYLLQYSQLFRTPNIQELLSTMLIRNLYNIDGIFIPGHTGDFISGGHLTIRALSRKNIYEISNSIIEFHSLIRPFFIPQLVRLSLERYLHNIWKEVKLFSAQLKPQIQPYELQEIFDWRERQYKYISSAIIPYIVYEYQFITPLWDKRLVNIFLKLTPKLKYKQKFYISFLFRNMFEPLEIDFRKYGEPSFLITHCEQILSRLPKIIQRYYSSLRAKVSEVSYKNYPQNPCGFDSFFPKLIKFCANTTVDKHITRAKSPVYYLSITTLFEIRKKHHEK